MIVGGQMQKLAVISCNDADGALAQAHCASSNRVEYGLGVSRRLPDYAEDLAQRDPLLQSGCETGFEFLGPQSVRLRRLAATWPLGFGLTR